MFIIVGLGNPTREYEGTRHNVGFEVIDALADKYNISVTERKSRAFCGKGIIAGQKVVLVKPQTYMNLSGESVRGLVDFYKIDVETELIVIFDDISLDVGQIRIRAKGSAGGHNGMKNIIYHLQSDEFPRVRFGIGTPVGELANYVLSNFSKEETKVLIESARNVPDIIEYIVNGDILKAMNKYN